MDKKTLLVLIDALVAKAVSEIEIPVSRGPRGLKGSDGNNFNLEDHKEPILSLIKESIPPFELTEELRLSLKGDKGDRGRDGRDGNSFNLEDHEKEIVSLIERTPINLSPEVLESLKGERGPQGEKGEQGLDGRNGRDGKSFDFEESRQEISEIISSHVESLKDKIKLRFSDLTEEEKESLQGPRGDRGKDFNFEESSEAIKTILVSYVASIQNELKLKFDDLTEDEKFSLRGPRGQRGKQGRDFEFAEHQEAISNILQSHLEQLKPQLKLEFKDLTKEDKQELTLKFEHLTEEEKFSLKGPRGQRGKKGDQGEQGKHGSRWFEGVGKPQVTGTANDFYLDTSSLDLYFFGLNGWEKKSNIRGARGEIGPKGERGARGAIGPSGLRGADGLPAPRIVDVEVSQDGDRVYLTFILSDGSRIETDYFEIPSPEVIRNTYIAAGVGGGGGGAGQDGKSAYEIAVENGFVGTEEEWLASLNAPPTTYEADGVEIGAFSRVNFVGGSVEEDPTGTLKVDLTNLSANLAVLDEGNLVTSSASQLNFIGPNVTVSPNVSMVDWEFLSDVEPSLSDYAGNPAELDKVNVFIEFIDPSIILDVTCSTDVYVGSFVRMDSFGVAVNALADGFANSNVIGLVEEKTAPDKCVIRVSGRSKNIYSGLDPTADYYLSDTVAGGIQTAVPTTSGHIRLRVGQPFSSASFLVSKGERVERL